MTCQKFKSKIIILYLNTSFLYLLVFFPLTDLSAKFLQDSENKLDQAEACYYDGDLDRAILLVSQCLTDSTLNKINRLRSYKILARIYLNKEDQQKAKIAVQKILQLDPLYLPTIDEEAPHFVSFVADIKKKQQTKPVKAESGIYKWVWIGAGSAAAAVLLVLVATGSGGGEEDNTNRPLPEPPHLP